MSKKDPPIQDLVISNIIPKLLVLCQDRNEDFLTEVCWILINIAAGNSSQTEFLVELNCIEFFNRMFDFHSENFELLYNALWCVGNISCDSENLRKIIINSRVFTHILNFVNACVSEKKNHYLEISMWCLGNIIGDHANIDMSSLDRIYFVISRILCDVQDDGIIDYIVINLARMAKKYVNIEYFTPDSFKVLVLYSGRTTMSNKMKVFKFFKTFCKRTKAGCYYFQDEEVLKVLETFTSKNESRFFDLFINFLAYFLKDSPSGIQKLVEMNFISNFQESLMLNLKKKPEKISFYICSALSYSDDQSFSKLMELKYIDHLFISGLLVKKKKYLESIVNTLETFKSRDAGELLEKYSKNFQMFKNHCEKNHVKFII
jgi:hypothetical protein